MSERPGDAPKSILSSLLGRPLPLASDLPFGRPLPEIEKEIAAADVVLAEAEGGPYVLYASENGRKLTPTEILSAAAESGGRTLRLAKIPCETTGDVNALGRIVKRVKGAVWNDQ